MFFRSPEISVHFLEICFVAHPSLQILTTALLLLQAFTCLLCEHCYIPRDHWTEDTFFTLSIRCDRLSGDDATRPSRNLRNAEPFRYSFVLWVGFHTTDEQSVAKNSIVIPDCVYSHSKPGPDSLLANAQVQDMPIENHRRLAGTSPTHGFSCSGCRLVPQLVARHKHIVRFRRHTGVLSTRVHDESPWAGTLPHLRRMHHVGSEFA